MAKGNGNGKKKIGGKQGPRAGERDKGGKERKIMSEAVGGLGQSARKQLEGMVKRKQAEKRKAAAKKKASEIIKRGDSRKQAGRDMPLPKTGKFKGWE